MNKEKQLVGEVDTRCWLCSGRGEMLNPPVDQEELFREASVMICTICGFIYKDPVRSEAEIRQVLSTSYYSKFGPNLIKRFKARRLVDLARFKSYHDYIVQYFDFRAGKRILDLGGAEGIFGDLLTTLYPDVEYVCLEPDQTAVECGKLLYNHLQFVDGRAEDLAIYNLGTFDLVIGLGLFYRTVNPRAIIESLYQITHQDSLLFFTLPFTLSSPERQAYESPESIDELLGLNRNGVTSIYDIECFRDLVETHFQIFKHDKRRNYPFRKIQDFFCCRRRAKAVSTNTIEYNTGTQRYIDNKAYVVNFANELTRLRIRERLKRFQSIAIFGLTDEAEILCEIVQEEKQAVRMIIDPEMMEDVNRELLGVPITSLSAVYDNNVDALIIADFQQQEEIYDQLVNRVQLNNMFAVVKGFKKKEYRDRRVCRYDDGKKYLQKAFTFEY